MHCYIHFVARMKKIKCNKIHMLSRSCATLCARTTHIYSALVRARAMLLSYAAPHMICDIAATHDAATRFDVRAMRAWRRTDGYAYIIYYMLVGCCRYYSCAPHAARASECWREHARTKIKQFQIKG